ncbi:hypothetical protein D3C71_2179280 [compost metagenome]
MRDCVGPLDLIRIIRVDQDHRMEVAIANVAENGSEQIVFQQIDGSRLDALGQSRDRYHRVGGH